MKKKTLILAIISIVYILIPTLILYNVISYECRFHVLILVGTISYLIALKLKYNDSDLGMKKKNIKESIKRVLPVTLMIFVLTLIYYFVGLSNYNNTSNIYFYIFYVLISCPIQELLYRSILKCYLDEFKISTITKIIISSILFSYLHIIYFDIYTLVFTLLIGLYWNYCYYKDNNIVGVTISHIILGVSTIILGII